ncbi:hypothetical protein [Brucella inopinata]|uniref:hypothetical protein n=1 Tax=Brucella inopinata TaxID=1218315 RepID=UPI001070E8ED|nr:hypothetical protein [Brucella inopinata]
MFLKLIESADLSFEVIRPENGRNLPEILYRFQLRGFDAARADECLESFACLNTGTMQAMSEYMLHALQELLPVAIAALEANSSRFQNITRNAISEDYGEPEIIHLWIAEIYPHAFEVSGASWVFVYAHDAPFRISSEMCMSTNISFVRAISLSIAAWIKRGQYLTGIDFRLFISEAAEFFTSMAFARDAVPPNVWKMSSTCFMSTISTPFMSLCQHDLCWYF